MDNDILWAVRMDNLKAFDVNQKVEVFKEICRYRS